MKTIKVVTQAKTISSNTTVMPEGFGGWLAQNIGTSDVVIDGFVLKPCEKLDCYAALPPECVWTSPIPVVFNQPGGQLRFERLKYDLSND